MVKKFHLITVCIISFSLFSCSKKTTPATSTSGTVTVVKGKTTENVKTGETVSGTDSAAAVKKVVLTPKPKATVTVPKVIVVNDAGAKKSVDGRLYYDMQGRRYWRNNKDGKYYLYNKSMHADPAFQPPAKKS